jgi:hypothetical protein
LCHPLIPPIASVCHHPFKNQENAGWKKYLDMYIHIGDVKNSSSILASTSVVVQTAHEPKSPHPPGTRAAERIPPPSRVCVRPGVAHIQYSTPSVRPSVRPSVHHPRPHVPANAVRCGCRCRLGRSLTRTERVPVTITVDLEYHVHASVATPPCPPPPVAVVVARRWTKPALMGMGRDGYICVNNKRGIDNVPSPLGCAGTCGYSWIVLRG